jgi:NADH-ubiquinone oxidoreductase chain 5
MLITGGRLILDFDIIALNSVEFNFIIIIDYVSLTFMGVVTLIARCVVYYSKDYIAGDPNIERFIWLVFMFVISMMALIIRPNIISILLGWDGLGLVSYALVIYYQNIKSFNAGILTALSNRIGDVIILISIALIASAGSFNFTHIDKFNTPMWGLTVVFITIAACTKSAQIPFSAWLPAAMAAPTPVSALVHSSTLVTAGVYLLIRFRNPLIASGVSKPLLIISILTILMAGIGANLETDLKKIIALSTLSQLGLIIIRIAMGAVKLGYFHILSHALFKALLFMCAGNIIHCRGDTQDLRKIGFISKQIPVTCVCINTANLALCGAPFIAGFYSKDLVLETLLNFSNSHIPVILAILATALTVTYSLRLSYYSIVTQPRCQTLFNLSDSAQFSCKAIIPLTFLSITGGLVMSWLLFPTPNLLFMPMITKTMILPTLAAGAILGVCI